MRIIIELDAKSEAILDRLRGYMTPSAFIQVLLQMVDSGATGSPPEKIDSDPQKRESTE
jgi:hypothetical protein